MFYNITYPFFFVVFRILIGLLGRLRISGRERVPKTGGFIYCPNHLSDADPPTVFVSLPRRAWFIGKSELFELPVLGLFFRNFHAFPIKRDSPDRAAIRRAQQCLERGDPILIFPEGRCSEDGMLQRIQPGAALLSVRSGAPIVPIGLVGTNRILPYGDRFCRFAGKPVTLTFGSPIDPKDYIHLRHGEAIDAICERLAVELVAMTGQQRRPESEGASKTAAAANPAAVDLPAVDHAK